MDPPASVVLDRPAGMEGEDRDVLNRLPGVFVCFDADDCELGFYIADRANAESELGESGSDGGNALVDAGRDRFAVGAPPHLDDPVAEHSPQIGRSQLGGLDRLR